MNASGGQQLELRVLVLAPTTRDAELTRKLLRDAGMESCVCPDLGALCREWEHGAGAAILSEESLLSDHARRFLAAVALQPAWSDLPILVLTRGEQNAPPPAGLDALGNVTLLERPVRLATLVSTVRAALRARARQYQIREHLVERVDAAQKLTLLNDTLEVRVAERTALAEAQAAQLRALTAALSEAEQRERRRLAQLLHDHLQQLLVAARLNVSALRGSPLAASFRPALAQIDDLLKESIEASRSLTLELSPPVLHQSGFVAALAWLGRWMQEKHGLAVRIAAAPDAEPANEHLRTVLFDGVRELLFNVVKHARVDSAEVRAMRQPDGLLQVVVSDAGSGFDLKTLQEDRAGDGGFGLFSIRERLQLLGGSFEMRSAPGQGTLTTLRVPSGPAAQMSGESGPDRQTQQSTADGTELARSKGSPGPIRVLLVDDHKIVRQGLAGLLRCEPDIEIVGEAGDGETAVRMAGALNPDVIVMDVNMPRLNGIEATRRIASEWPHIRIIGLSMHDEKDLAEELREAGASAYLTKGGPSENLVDAIRHSPSKELQGAASSWEC